MRLSFGNGEHPDVVVAAGNTSLGSAEGNTLVLPGRDIAPRHARVIVDARGGILEVLSPGARTHVNARPVCEKALLRHGDVVCLGKTIITLKLDRDDLIYRPPTSVATLPAPLQPSRVVLRGVSGNYYGITIEVNPRIVIGRDPACDLIIDEPGVEARHATLECVDESILLRSLVPANAACTVSVCGVCVRDAVVRAGDQLVFGRSHFVVEAPSLPTRGDDDAAIRDSILRPQAVNRAAGDPSVTLPGQGAMWWLVAVAALIAIGLVILFQRGL